MKTEEYRDMLAGVDNDNYSDVTFDVEGKMIKCHRVILMQHEYFRMMLGAGNSRLREAQQSVVPISEVNIFDGLSYH